MDRAVIMRDDSYFDQSSLATINPFSFTLNRHRALGATFASGGDTRNLSRFLAYSETVAEFNIRSVNQQRADIFQRTIQETGWPALALQAPFHTLTADGFYYFLPFHDTKTDYSASFALSVFQPVRSLGFFIMLTYLAIHLILVGFITIHSSGILHSTTSSFSFINNVWQAHAQSLSSQVEEILREPAVTMASDREVNKALGKSGQHKFMLVLEPNEKDEHGAIRLRRKFD
ncbi:hypothetical protein LTR84_003515 [Exophiala bonariae]|uniref:Uncharacterized protein n=1 Tax=Exophiala bonariae TaxID=1690606 RepID=A0AAV9NAY5_9EURO|nr:hypothetical protein LTR84_003515 [Exophiala bonariae]